MLIPFAGWFWGELVSYRDMASVVEALVVEYRGHRVELDVVEVLQGDIPTDRIVFRSTKRGGCGDYPGLRGSTVLVVIDVGPNGHRRSSGCLRMIPELLEVHPFEAGVCVSRWELADAYRSRRSLQDTLLLPWPFRPRAAPEHVGHRTGEWASEDCEVRRPDRGTHLRWDVWR